MNLPRKILIILALATILFSCANNMDVLNKFIDPEEEPDITGINVEMQQSDSARLLVKMITPLLKRYESAKDARDEFPEGLHVWLYEKTGELKAEVTANWAKYDVAAKLWEARSNVVLISADGRKLETEQLFWDTQKGIVYSEKYTKITNEDGTLATGDTFWATQDFSEYKLKKGRATIFLKDEEDKLE